MSDVQDGDDAIMQRSEKICEFLRLQFANITDKLSSLSSTSSSSKSINEKFSLEIDPIHKLDSNELTICLGLLSINLGTYYESRHGANWMVDKLEEMQELGLIYARFYTTTDEGKHDLQMFVSFMLVEDNDLEVLYVYELQILPGYRHLGIGTMLINDLEQLVKLIRKSPSFVNFKPVGISLTCFSDNTNLLSFYRKNEFKMADYSPMDKQLRSGKLVKPDYYILLKRVV